MSVREAGPADAHRVADLAALTREAAIDSVRRIMPRIDLSAGTIPQDVLDSLSVTRDDFVEAL